MNFTFRDLIIATRNRDNDRIPAWRHLLDIAFIGVGVIIWFTTAASLAIACTAFFAKAVTYPQQADIWQDLLLISPWAFCFVGITVMASEFPEAVKLLWYRLEDMLGRPIVWCPERTDTDQVPSPMCWLRFKRHCRCTR